jgi:maltose/moltooligosaccharide transporter
VYMGIFNFFIVIPEILAALLFGRFIRAAFGADNPNASLYMVMIGGVSMLIAALAVMIVHDAGDADVAAVIEGDAHERLTVQGSVQPVPSTGPGNS